MDGRQMLAHIDRLESLIVNFVEKIRCSHPMYLNQPHIREMIEMADHIERVKTMKDQEIIERGMRDLLCSMDADELKEHLGKDKYDELVKHGKQIVLETIKKVDDEK